MTTHTVIRSKKHQTTPAENDKTHTKKRESGTPDRHYNQRDTGESSPREHIIIIIEKI